MIKGYQVNPYPLRIPMELRGWLEKKAADENRSLQKEIIHTLDQLRKKEQQSANQ